MDEVAKALAADRKKYWNLRPDPDLTLFFSTYQPLLKEKRPDPDLTVFFPTYQPLLEEKQSLEK